MQDRFKRRIYDKKNNKFYYDFIGFTFNPKEITIYHSEFFSTIHNIKDIIIQFCTGLKDKNGKLIYEGDIVEYDRSDLIYGAEIIRGYISFRKFEYVINYYSKNIINAETREPSLQKIWIGCDDFLGSRTTIIGNIYENPELLEG